MSMKKSTKETHSGKGLGWGSKGARDRWGSTAYMHSLSTTVLCGRCCPHHFVHKATETQRDQTQTQSLSDSRTRVGSLGSVLGLPLNRHTPLVRSLQHSEARRPSKKFCPGSKWNCTPHIALLCRSREIACKKCPALHRDTPVTNTCYYY